MIGRTVIEHNGKKHRVDKIWAVPFYDFQLYFDAHNTWVDLQPVLGAIQGLDHWKMHFKYATTGAVGDLFAVQGLAGEHIVLGLSGGKFKLSNELGDNTLVMDAVDASNNGQMNQFELDVNAGGHFMYVNGEYLNRAYTTGGSGVSLSLPATITAASLGKGVLTGFFSGVIKNLVFTNQADDVLVSLKLNDKANTVQDSVSGNFATVHNAFWEDGFNENPEFREVLNAYACRTAGSFENVHRG